MKTRKTQSVVIGAPIALGAVALGWSTFMLPQQRAVAQPASDDQFNPVPVADMGRPLPDDGFDGPRNRPPHPPGPPLEEMLTDLTPEQRSKIRAIHERTRRDIDAVLTPAQRERLQQFGPPPGPRGDRPGPGGYRGGPGRRPSGRGGHRDGGFRDDGPRGGGPRGGARGGDRFGGGPDKRPPGPPQFGRGGMEPGGMGPQDGGPPRRGPEPPIESMSWMLDLNPVQQQRIKGILSAAELKTEQLRSNTTLVPEEKGPQMRRIHEETREQIEAVLTPAQREKMQQSRERGRPPRHFG